MRRRRLIALLTAAATVLIVLALREHQERSSNWSTELELVFGRRSTAAIHSFTPPNQTHNAPLRVVTLALPNPGWWRAELLDRGDVPRDDAKGLTDWVAAHDAFAACNAGYVDARLLPVGLWIADSVERQPVLNQPPLSGVVWADDDSRVNLDRASDTPRDAVWAFQAGPFVIDPGGRVGINNPNGSAARRTVLALTDTDHLLLIHTEPCRLHDLARALHNSGLRIDRALNLDGGPSAGLDLAPLPELSREPTGPIRQAIVFTLR